MKPSSVRLAFALLVFLPCMRSTRSEAQDEASRFRSGQVKVGDQIGANPTHSGPMDVCTVVEIVPDPVRAGYDGDYVVRCDKAPWTRVSATGDHARILPQGTVQAVTRAGRTAGAPAITTARVGAVGNATAAQAPVGATASTGNRFGSRDPRSCAAVTGGTPSPSVAATLVACAREAQSSLHSEMLVSNVRVTSMTPSVYDPHTQTGFTNMDTRVAPVAIKGSLESWSCREQDPPTVMQKYSNVGANCDHRYENRAAGYCYKMRTGAWTCTMWETDLTTAPTQHGVPPPR